ncbi:MAG: TIM barrel protein [bacterium]
MTPGLVSVTFRQLAPEAIIELCLENNLWTIEWGGDIHVPHGAEGIAARVGEMTRAAGLTVAGYGSYYRLGGGAGPDFAEVLASAKALGAPVVRVWAGSLGSADTSEGIRQRIAADALRCADLAGAEGLSIAYEFHANTLTDTTSSAVDLLEATRHPFIKTLWQPPHGLTVEECVQSLSAIASRLQHLHVFHWWPDGSRRFPLHEGKQRWRTYIDQLRRLGASCPLLLEFVRDDNPAVLKQDASTLAELCAAFS